MHASELIFFQSDERSLPFSLKLFLFVTFNILLCIRFSQQCFLTISGCIDLQKIKNLWCCSIFFVFCIYMFLRYCFLCRCLLHGYCRIQLPRWIQRFFNSSLILELDIHHHSRELKGLRDLFANTLSACWKPYQNILLKDLSDICCRCLLCDYVCVIINRQCDLLLCDTIQFVCLVFFISMLK